MSDQGTRGIYAGRNLSVLDLRPEQIAGIEQLASRSSAGRFAWRTIAVARRQGQRGAVGEDRGRQKDTVTLFGFRKSEGGIRLSLKLRRAGRLTRVTTGRLPLIDAHLALFPRAGGIRAHVLDLASDHGSPWLVRHRDRRRFNGPRIPVAALRRAGARWQLSTRPPAEPY